MLTNWAHSLAIFAVICAASGLVQQPRCPHPLRGGQRGHRLRARHRVSCEALGQSARLNVAYFYSPSNLFGPECDLVRLTPGLLYCLADSPFNSVRPTTASHARFPCWRTLLLSLFPPRKKDWLSGQFSLQALPALGAASLPLWNFLSGT